MKWILLIITFMLLSTIVTISQKFGDTYYSFAYHPGVISNIDLQPYKIYVFSKEDANVTLTVKAIDLKIDKSIKANVVTVFELTPEQALCYNKQLNEAPLPDSIYVGKAINLYSSSFFQAYATFQGGQSGEAMMLDNINQLGKEYIITTPTDFSNNSSIFGTNYITIVGIYENTKVSIKLGGNETVMTAGGQRLLQTKNKTISAGDVCVIAGLGIMNEMTGSIIKANKPIAVFTGSQCASMFGDGMDVCGYVINQEQAQNKLGKSYPITPIKGADSSSYISIIPADTNTTIYRDGLEIAHIAMPGGRKFEGYFPTIAFPGENHNTTISANKTINITQINPNWKIGSEINTFQNSVVPLERFNSKSLEFATPATDFTGYTTNYLNLIFQAHPQGLIPPDLLLGYYDSNGDLFMKPISTYETSYLQKFIDPQMALKNYYSMTVKLPQKGVYKITSSSDLAAYQYGYIGTNCYGLQVNDNFIYNLDIDTIAPVINGEQLCNCAVQGEIIDPNTDSLATGLNRIYLDAAQSYNYNFSYDDFVPGNDKKVKYNLMVMDRNLPAKAVLIVSDISGNETTREFNCNLYQYQIVIKEKELNFGAIELDSKTIEKELTLVNLSNEYTSLINYVYLKSIDNHDSTVFEIDTNSLNLSIPLKPLEERRFKVRLNTNKIGVFSDSIGCTICYVNYFTSLKATIMVPTINLEDVFFGEWKLKEKSLPHIISIKNPLQNGIGLPLKIYGFVSQRALTGMKGSNKAFEIEGLENVTKENPIIIQPDSSYQLKVTFSPILNDVYLDYIIILANASKPKNVLKLFGAGNLSGLDVNNINWGERKAILNKYNEIPEIDTSSYISPNGKFSIKNIDNKDLTIISANVVSNTIPNSFFLKIDNKLVSIDSSIKFFQNKLIKVGDSLAYDIYFRPNTSGVYVSVVSFQTHDNTTAMAEFRGTANYPIAKVTNVDFGKLNIDQKYAKSQIIIENTKWQFADPMIIYKFVIKGKGDEISDMNSIGTKFFRWDKNNITNSTGDKMNFPISIAPSDKIFIPVEFQRNTPGNYIAEIEAITNADAYQIATLSASVITSLEEILSEPIELEIFPNPASEIVNIRFNNIFVNRIQLLDLFGNTIMELSDGFDNYISLKTNNLESQQYFIKVYTDNQIYMKKLVIVK